MEGAVRHPRSSGHGLQTLSVRTLTVERSISNLFLQCPQGDLPALRGLLTDD